MQNRVVEGLEFRVLSALRVPDRPFSRREADLFTCFLRYRARLPRPHPPREGLPDGLHDGWYGRRKNRNKYAKPAKRRHVCMLIVAVSKHQNVLICYPTAAKSTRCRPSGETSAGGLAFCHTSNAKGLRDPERKEEYLTPVEL